MKVKALALFAVLLLVVLAACAPAPTPVPPPTTAPAATTAPTAAPKPTTAPTTAASSASSASSSSSSSAAAVAPTTAASSSSSAASSSAASSAPAATGAATKAATGPTNTPAPTATPPPPAVTAAAGAIKIQFWHYFTDPTQVAAIQRFADKFNAANPQYYIVPTLQGAISDLSKKINASITANALPDMATGNPGDLFDYNTAGVMAPLDQYINDATVGLTKDQIADMQPNELFFDKIGGQTIGMSVSRSENVMFYNIDMLKAAGFSDPPKTWDDFDKICAAVTKGDQYCYPATASSMDTSFFASAVFSRGGTYASPDEKQATFDEQAGIDTLKWLKNQATTGWGKVPTVTSRGDQADFGNGKVAFAFGSTAGLPFFQDAVNGRKEGPFQWSIAPIPAGPKGKQVVDIFGPSLGIFKSTPDKQKGAWLFMKSLLQKDTQVEWTQRFLYFPASKTARDAVVALDDASAKATNPRFGLVAPQFKKAVSLLPMGVREPLSPAWQGVRSTIADMLTAVFTGKSSANFTATDPEAAAKEGVQRVNKLLSQYGK